MWLNLKTEINDTFLEAIINAFNNLSEKDILHLYINSEGGDHDIMAVASSVINRNKERTILYGWGQLYSSAFELFVRAQCKKHIVGSCIGMYHQVSTPIYVGFEGKPSHIEDVVKLEIAKKTLTNQSRKIFGTKGITLQQRKKLMEGEDAYFTTEQLASIVKATILK
jgi:ATP-dependent protease ClpP protease subunit